MSSNIYFQDVELGDEIGPIERTVTDEEVLQFVAVGGRDPEPSRFTSKAIAQSEGLSEAIIPGAMNIALMSRQVTGWADTVCLKKIDVVFRQTVPHNKPLIFTGIVTNKDESGETTDLECDITMENNDGVKMVIGNAEFALPNKPGI